MGSLAHRIALEFQRLQPRGWSSELEAPLLSPELQARAGFDVRGDLVFQGPDGERIVVELEISRADPIANPAKFLLAQKLGGLRPEDGFAGLVSPHVVAAKRNQTALFTSYLRESGLAAFHLSLLPDLSRERIHELNHLDGRILEREKLPYRRELDRVFKVLTPRGERDHRIHFVGDAADVIANLRTWNDELASAGADRWGRRRVQFFVFDMVSGLFAPSKFCAFLPARRPGGPPPPPTMTMKVYAQLGEEDPRFDGNIARRHLARSLAFEDAPLADRPSLRPAFDAWLTRVGRHLLLREPVRLLQPPAWFRGG